MNWLEIEKRWAEMTLRASPPGSVTVIRDTTSITSRRLQTAMPRPEAATLHAVASDT